MFADLAPDLRRALAALFALAALCLVLAFAYSHVGWFLDPLRGTLPDLTMTAESVVIGFQVGAVLCVLWANLLMLVASPASAAGVLRLGARAVSAESSRSWAWIAALALAGAYALARVAFNVETVHASLAEFTAGEARRPFQYRALVPWLVAALREVPGLSGVSLWTLYGAVEAVAAAGVWAATASMAATLLGGRAAGRVAALAVFVPLALNLVPAWRHNNIFFPYDTASVAFFALGLSLLLSGRMRWYYLVFVVATLNRETSCFLAMAYLALAWGRTPALRIAAHVSAQAVLWLAVKAALWIVFQDTGAIGYGVFVNTLAMTGRILTAVPGLVYALVVPLGGAATVAWLLRRRVADERLRRLAWIVPPFLLGMALVGEVLEVRIYSELVPLVAMALVVALRDVAHAAAPATSAAPVAPATPWAPSPPVAPAP